MKNHLILHAAACLALAGCATPFDAPRRQAMPPGDADFPGLIQLTRTGGTGAPPVKAILVHGMCTHDAGWAHDTIARLAAHLQGSVLPDPAARPAPTPGPGPLRVHARIEAKAASFNVAAIVWSPLTAQRKRALCYDNGGDARVCLSEPAPSAPLGPRAAVNAKLKTTLLNDCFADAVAYLGSAGPSIRSAMRRALDESIDDDDQRVAFITSSLGSKIVYDTLIEWATLPTAQGGGRGMRLLGQVSHLYMLANQLPLLELGGPTDAGAHADVGTATATGPSLSTGIDQLVRLRQLAMARTQGSAAGIQGEAPELLRVVSFTDPNDLLSYPLAGKPGTLAAPLIDVVDYNVPVFAGWVANPWSAHMSYWKNPDVLDMLVCGSHGCGP